jgi:hypothetical protein
MEYTNKPRQNTETIAFNAENLATYFGVTAISAVFLSMSIVGGIKALDTKASGADIATFHFSLPQFESSQPVELARSNQPIENLINAFRPAKVEASVKQVSVEAIEETPVVEAVKESHETPENALPSDIRHTYNPNKLSVEELRARDYIFYRESSHNPFAVNPNGGACGLPQALPCSKLTNVCGELNDVECQIRWSDNYAANRYGSYEEAVKHWEARVPIAGKNVGHWW